MMVALIQNMSNSTVWSIIISVLFVGWLVYSVFKAGVDDDKFRTTGIKVEAKILGKRDIGSSGTGNTKYKIDLEFQTENGVIRTHARYFFTPEELIKIMRKNTVLLYYLPQDPRQVYLVPEDME